MRKVLHIISSWGTGGVERYIYNYSKYLKEYCFDVLTLRESSTKSIFNSENINVYHLKKVEGNFLTRIQRRKKLLIDFLEEHKYDIIHFDMTTADGFILAKAIKKNFSSKIVMHCHATNVEPPNTTIKKILHYFSKCFYIKYADFYIGLSNETMKWMYNKKIIKSNKCTILKCGIEINDFQFDKDIRNNIRKKYNIQDKFVIGTVGRFSNQKNVPFILEFIKQYSKINNKFIFLWIGTGELFEYAKKMIKEQALEEKVIFTGVTDHIERFYSSMDVFILPSFYEGNPIVLAEAQANGLKCLVSDKITRSSDVSGNVKFLRIDNIDLWLKEIKSIEKDTSHNINIDHMKRMGILVEDNARKLEKIYDDLIGELK